MQSIFWSLLFRGTVFVTKTNGAYSKTTSKGKHSVLTIKTSEIITQNSVILKRFLCMSSQKRKTMNSKLFVVTVYGCFLAPQGPHKGSSCENVELKADVNCRSSYTPAVIPKMLVFLKCPSSWNVYIFFSWCFDRLENFSNTSNLTQPSNFQEIISKRHLKR